MEAFGLATTFLANMLSVVLIGLVLTEVIPYVMHYMRARQKQQTPQEVVAARWVFFDHIVLLLLVLYQGGLIVYSTLAGDVITQHETLWIHNGVLILLLILIACWRSWPVRITAGIFVVSMLLSAAAATGILKASPLFMLFVYNTGLFSFYFFLVMYSIAMRTKDYERYVAMQKLCVWQRTLLAMALVTLFLGAYAFSLRTVSVEQQEVSAAMHNVTVQLKWQHSAQFAGYYMADAEGLYSDAGIRAVFLPLAPGTYSIEEVMQSRADFGIASGLELVHARAEGKPIIALAAIYQRDPLVAYVLASSSIKKYEDIVSARVGATSAPNLFSYAIREHIQRHAINPDTLNAVFAGHNENDALLRGAIDVAFGYETIQVELLRQEGYDVRVLQSNVGQAYGDVLFTSEAVFAQYPDMVAAFTKATRDGWEHALKYPNQAIDAVLRYDHGTDITMTPEDQHILLEAERSYLKPTESFAVGVMSNAIWGSMIQSLYDAGLITALIKPEDFVYQSPE